MNIPHIDSRIHEASLARMSVEKKKQAEKEKNKSHF